MRRFLTPICLVLATLSGSSWAAGTVGPAITIETSLGTIVVVIDAQHAPATAANFLRYVDGGHYDNGRFHRTVTPGNQPQNDVKIEVIQAGVNPKRASADFPAIALERTRDTGLRHVAGTISMARDGPDTATSDFFICVTDQPALDFGGGRNPDGQGFAAFGQVVSGMSVVVRIQHSRARGQHLSPPIRILSIHRAGAG